MNVHEDRIAAIKKRNAARKKQHRRRIIILTVLAVVVLIIVFIILKSIVSFFAGIFRDDTDKKDSHNENAVSVEVIPVIKTKNDIPEASVQNDMLEILKTSGSTEKVCYLTFDDGPNTTITPQILDILRRYNIKATFFQVGSLIEQNKDMAQRVYEEGHLIGGHSYDHTYSKIYGSTEGFLEEMDGCANLIREITGEDDFFPIIRFPGGSYNSGKYGEAKQEFKKLLAENGVYHCDWNCLNGDAEGSSKTPEQLLNRTKESAADQKQVVVLMHDTVTKKNTVEALPDIIEYFLSEGYTFERLDNPVLK